MSKVTREEADRLYKMLDPHRGKWIAVDFYWQKVLAVAVERKDCVELAKKTDAKNAIIHFVRPTTVQENINSFKSEPFYEPEGDSLVWHFVEEESFAQYHNARITLYRSLRTPTVVTGIQYNGTKKMLRDLVSNYSEEII